MMFRVARSREGVTVSHYDLYKVEITKGMTILDALFQIQDKIDSSLSFRYSCRGAVCGSCAMLINKEPQLACRTQVSYVKEMSLKLEPFTAITQTPSGWDPEKEILIEPLPNLPILKDLIVDMSRFYKALETMKLWADTSSSAMPGIQSPSDRQKIERYVNCIMCALCFGSCPVNAENENYVGPAALAKAWRFHEDSRTPDKGRFYTAATRPEGAQLCELIMNCVKVCPKGVAPGGAIRKLKQLQESK
jgi:succinate dehydrogenase / fumarate reductase iron-sulfur subunit